MRIGLVAEGTSDFLVLEAVIGEVRADAQFVRLHPDVGALAIQGGWRSLKSWCEEYGARLNELMHADATAVLDALVIHVDCSMANKVDAARPCPPASATGRALESVVLSWLGIPTSLPWLLVVTPAQCTEAWVVAALQPPWDRLASIECEPAHKTENVLVARGLLRKRGTSVKKPSGRYAPLAAGVAKHLGTVRSQCTELDRFASLAAAL